MRIGIICHSSCGGSTRVALELSFQMTNRGHTVHLFSPYPPFGLKEDRKDLITHYPLGHSRAGLDPSFLKTEWSETELEKFTASLVEVILGEGLDVLHFHYAVPFVFIISELKNRLGGKCPFLVGTLHGTDVNHFGRDPLWAARLREALLRVDQVTTVSADHARLAYELLGLPFLPRVIPNFLRIDMYKSGPGKAPLPHKPARIVHISNFRPVKAPLELAGIFALISSRIEAELWLVGDGPGLEEIKALLSEWGLSDRIHFWGMQAGVGSILEQSDLLLMTSKAESFCLAILEAMACGVPVVATRVGGIPELVRHGETGFLFTPGNQSQAANFAVQLLTGPDLYARFAAMARIQAQFFSPDRIVELYEEIYKLAFIKINR